MWMKHTHRWEEGWVWDRDGLHTWWQLAVMLACDSLNIERETVKLKLKRCKIGLQKSTVFPRSTLKCWQGLNLCLCLLVTHRNAQWLNRKPVIILRYYVKNVTVCCGNLKITSLLRDQSFNYLLVMSLLVFSRRNRNTVTSSLWESD